jgi:cytochrome bd-type quinol oxidase subunit 2
MLRTNLGKWSVISILIFILLFALFLILVASGQKGGETFFSNLALSVPMLIAAIAGISSFVIGIISIIKGERSFLVFISSAVGLLVLVFVLGEFIFPH